MPSAAILQIQQHSRHFFSKLHTRQPVSEKGFRSLLSKLWIHLEFLEKYCRSHVQVIGFCSHVRSALCKTSLNRIALQFWNETIKLILDYLKCFIVPCYEAIEEYDTGVQCQHYYTHHIKWDVTKASHVIRSYYYTLCLWRVGCNSFDIVCVCVCVCPSLSFSRHNWRTYRLKFWHGGRVEEYLGQV